MPAPLTRERMEEIARVVASSPTMDGAALALGYKNGRSLTALIVSRPVLRNAVRKSRKAAGRATWNT